ncbi:MAG: carbonate dehydratase [Acidobacteria bacterium]|nr:carbonate dehydratase [Acidobacteriota bacterium]
MNKLKNLLEQNKQWAKSVKKSDPTFFEKLSELQTPEFLWIGCSDSRITPATSIGLLPGEMFVHRNIANLVIHTDMNCLSVIQFAVDVLKVKHIIVCGHYNCGGVKAAFENTRFGLIDNWLRHIQDLAHKYEEELNNAKTANERLDKLCEINVIEQVVNVGETTIVQDAWLRGQNLTVHGWIYYITDGIYQDLNVTIESLEDMRSLLLKTLNNRQEIGVGG